MLQNRAYGWFEQAGWTSTTAALPALPRTALAGLFPTAVRYTGVSLTFNLAGIVGASLDPYAATWLASRYGVAAVGYYLSFAALLSLAALWIIRARSAAPELTKGTS